MMEERPDSGEHLAQQLPAGDTWEMYWQKPGVTQELGTDFQRSIVNKPLKILTELTNA